MITSGTKLGPYEIVAALGAGGMGEVYRARDTRLGREVAIKVLPQHLSSNPDLKARFEREAKAISALNHPHICHLYDVGSQAGTDYLVMELLEGETLDKKLERGPLPLKQTLEVGVQIAEALEKAHKSGIVHRDLKPGNIVLTKEGAKLLDFGLAKPNLAAIGAIAGASSGKLTPSTPTMSVAALASPAGGLTQQGTIVGTFQYMAPECLQGQEADARSDLFSFGCVLYEMVTGKRAFPGKSQLSVLTAILEKDPEPVSKFQPAIPAALEHAIQTCLEKNPEDRLQTAHDVRVQLAWIARTGSSATITLPGRQNKSGSWKLFAAAGIVIALAATLFSWWRGEPVRHVTRSTLLPPEGTRFAPLYRNGPPALSPDGTKLAFVASRNGKISLWMRSLDKLEATELPGTEGAYFPFWSPDGRSIGFLANDKLWRMNATGGTPLAICDAPDTRGASWGKSDTILFGTLAITIMRVPAAGGAPVRVTANTTQNQSDRWPFFLPDGKHFVYLHSPTASGSDRNEIHFASLDGRVDKIVLKGRYYIPEYASGWLVVGRGGALVAQRMDPETGELSGEPVQIAGKLQVDDNTASSVFSVSQNGALVYLQGADSGAMRHEWMDAKGKVVSEVDELGVYGATRISPDGTRMVSPFYEQAGEVNIWMWDLERGTRAQVSHGGKTSDTPVWSPDGRTVYYASSPDDSPMQIYRRPADGSQPAQRVIEEKTAAFVNDVSTDGKWLLYQVQLPETQQYSALKAVPLTEGSKPLQILERVDVSSNAVLMPGSDEWLAYTSSESGRSEIYLTRFPNAGAKYQVSVAGGMQPVWSKDGRRLYYIDLGQRLMVVEVQKDKQSVRIGGAKSLFQTSVGTIAGAGYDVTRDGRFLMLNWQIDTPSPMTLVMNWDAELNK